MYIDSEAGKRVGAYAVRMARGIVDFDKLQVIREVARLRKLGCVVIFNMIWEKPGRLHSDEISIMRKFPEYGYRMLMQIPDFEETAELVYSHQERFDGTGYPRGLKGDRIPLISRILSVAGTVDAITSDRPYRQAKSFADASDEIQRWAGRQFDPEIVNAFTKIPLPFWEEARRHPDWVHD